MTDDAPDTSGGRRFTLDEKYRFIRSVEARMATDNLPQVVDSQRLYREMAANLLAELAEQGFAVESVGELRQRKANYREAVPTLIDWLPRVSYLPLVEDIIRTLSVGFARKHAVPLFLRLFREPPSVSDPRMPQDSPPPTEHIRWVIGNGLGILASPRIADDLIELARLSRFGSAREQIVANLPKVRDDRVLAVLMELLADPSVVHSAIEALGRIKFHAARKPIAQLSNSSDQNVRNKAKWALKRLDNDAQRVGNA